MAIRCPKVKIQQTGDRLLPPLSEEDAAAVRRFREFVRIPSVCGTGHTNGAYRKAADWLIARCKEVGAKTSEVSPVEGKPIVIATLEGSEPDLPGIILNGHYDVVPCDLDKWCCDPFSAEIREGYVLAKGSLDEEEYGGKGGPCIYGRGTQDMKCVLVQYLEALERLQKQHGEGWKPRRTCHLTFVPDEEIGGADGMGLFLKTPEFEALKPVALALDEGLACPRDTFTVFYGERLPWWLLVRAKGPTGHGSRFVKNTAVEKLLGVVNKAQAFRREQEELLGWDCCGCKHGQARKLGDVTTLNCTMLKGGVSMDGGKTYSLNVVPTEMEAGFDVRISPSLATSAFKAKLDDWCSEEGLSWEFASWTKPLDDHAITGTDEKTNPLWTVFEEACGSEGTKVEREIFPAATDSRFLRAIGGLRALGFSPLQKCPILLHEHNEALSVDSFLGGIKTYCRVISALLDAPRQADEMEGGAAGEEPAAKRAKTGP